MSTDTIVALFVAVEVMAILAFGWFVNRTTDRIDNDSKGQENNR